MTLEAGDLIFTGTPAGVGKAIPGDVIEAYVDNLPKIEVRIES
jgi:fumarylpyruvate hydrolase